MMCFLDKENRRIYDVWFAQSKLASLFAVMSMRPGEAWQLELHVRIFVDDKVHNSKDRRSDYGRWGGHQPPELEALVFDKCFRDTAVALGASEVERIAVRGDVAALIEAIRTRPWAHVLEQRQKAGVA
jgi:hypothetical protein